MTSHLRLIPTSPVASAVDAVTSLHTDLSSALSGRPLRVAYAHDHSGKGAGDRLRAEVDHVLPGVAVDLLPVQSPPEAVLSRDADIAALDLHSCAETIHRDLSHRLHVAAVLRRADVRYQAYTAYHGVQLSHLRPDATVGVATALGVAQISHWRPSLRVQPLDGDADDWPDRVRIGDLDAIVFDHLHRPASRARLYPSPLATSEPSLSGLRAVPDTHSGLVGVICRHDVNTQTDHCLDGVLARLGERLRDFAAFAAYVVEQTCLTRVRDGGAPIGDVAIHAGIEDGVVSLVAAVVPTMPSGMVRTICQTGLVQRARDVGIAVADALRDDRPTRTVIPMPLRTLRVSPAPHAMWTASRRRADQQQTTT